MTSHIPKRWDYYLLASIAIFLWGSAFAGAKIGFEYMPPVMLSGVRFTLAGLILLPLTFLSKVSWRSQLRHWRFMLTFGFIQTFLQYGLFYAGLNLVPGAIASIIIGAGPLFIAIMAHFTLKDDKLDRYKILAVALGVLGVGSICMQGETLTADNPHLYLGIFLLMISNIVGSYTNIMVVKWGDSVSPIALTMVANLSGGIALFVASLFIEGVAPLCGYLPLKFWGAIVWLAIIPAAGFSIWYNLLARPDVKVSELNVLKFGIPVVGVILSWLLLPNEYPTWGAVIGISIISLSLFSLQLPTILKKREQKSKKNDINND